MEHIKDILPRVAENLQNINTEKEKAKINQSIDILIELVDNELDRYTEDEAGQEQRKKYLAMSDADKLALFTNTVVSCSNWEDFYTDLVINFDFCRY